MLVAAFRATLEEVIEADVILHVRDIAHEDADAQQSDVETVLRQLGIDPDAGQRILEVWNKIDRFDAEERENLKNIAARRPPERPCFLVSAETGRGDRRTSSGDRDSGWPRPARRSICRSTPPTAPASAGCIATRKSSTRNFMTGGST